MALVNLSVSQNKKKTWTWETDRQTGTDIQGELWGREDVHESGKELGALEVVNIHGIHMI